MTDPVFITVKLFDKLHQSRQHPSHRNTSDDRDRRSCKRKQHLDCKSKDTISYLKISSESPEDLPHVNRDLIPAELMKRISGLLETAPG